MEWPQMEEYDKLLLAMEKDMLGLYLTGHPLDTFEDQIRQHVTHFHMSLRYRKGDHHENKLSNQFVHSGTCGGCQDNQYQE